MIKRRAFFVCLAPQSNQPFNSPVFPPSPLNFGNKDGVNGNNNNNPFTGFLTNFPPVQTIGTNFFATQSPVPNFPYVTPKPVLSGPSTVNSGNLPQGFNVQTTGLGSPFPLSQYPSFQGVPVGGFNPSTTSNVGLTQFSAPTYKFPQDALTSFVPQGSQPVVTSNPTYPVFPGSFPTVPNSVFQAAQGLLKPSVSGTQRPTFNVPNLNVGNPTNDVTTTVFRTTQ